MESKQVAEADAEAHADDVDAESAADYLVGYDTTEKDKIKQSRAVRSEKEKEMIEYMQANGHKKLVRGNKLFVLEQRKKPVKIMSAIRQTLQDTHQFSEEDLDKFEQDVKITKLRLASEQSDAEPKLRVRPYVEKAVKNTEKPKSKKSSVATGKKRKAQPKEDNDAGDEDASVPEPVASGSPNAKRLKTASGAPGGPTTSEVEAPPELESDESERPALPDLMHVGTQNKPMEREVIEVVQG